MGIPTIFFPEKIDLRKVTDIRIKEVERLLNYQPARNFNHDQLIEILNNNMVTLMG